MFGRRVSRSGGCAAAALLLFLPQQIHAQQRIVPSPSQVAPPSIAPAPSAPARILLPRVEAGAEIPKDAEKLTFVLRGFSIADEFDELAAERRALEAPLIGKRVSVAQIFAFANALQAAYVRAGYPLVRVVVTPQELGQQARVAIRVVDGFVESIDAAAIRMPVRTRVLAVVEQLIGRRHLRQTELERVLLIAGDAPGLVLNAVFTGGKQVGGSVLVLTGRYRPVSASLYGDNAMPKVFGTWQAVATASLNSVFGLGEQFVVSASGLPDNDFATTYPTRRYLSASLTLPLGIDGWRLEGGGTVGKTTPRVDPIFATQGLLSQGRIGVSYDAVKRRDGVLTFIARFEATDEEVDSLLFEPSVPISRDRVRAVRGGVEGFWNFRSSGTVASYGALLSRGVDAFGARTANDATFLLPLSRIGADAVFTKLSGHVGITQGLPSDFFLSLAGYGQTSFGQPMLTSEQFDIVGAQMLSGYTAGSFAGDSAWVVRGEVGRNFVIPNAPAAIAPYLFAATGERILIEPTALERASMHASNLGGGLRFNLSAVGANPFDVSLFAEGSHQHSDNPTQQGWRAFAGGIVRY
ncbi:ShlB/FhaC/HecB family hemolysin secretion/activation protein [Bradyrhizobium japonicum]|uniref:ShlB/FhaC/HecB family hemolysin secretion/activation protein n=1 Tax=Bradyrhizobium japonicum TaxID=375 RepID=UPI001BAD5615|nr:ShlB/FhaC/HecB family hemolysin secretion/activation protein [Bradyrhizobium japonicum]MBR0956645.1 ShlB/FhaC/HecB family hemolysin secretion/activation protein [Bradyrhizobium japonicum]